MNDASSSIAASQGAGGHLNGSPRIPTTTDPAVKVGVGGGFVTDHAWGPAFGLGWFTTDVSSGGLAIGQLQTRPVMGGVGYTWVRGRFATNPGVK